MPTRAEFAASIKAKYPVYANVPDDQLVDRMLEKYPTYRDRIQEEPPPAQGVSFGQAVMASPVTQGLKRAAEWAITKQPRDEGGTVFGNIADPALSQAINEAEVMDAPLMPQSAAAFGRKAAQAAMPSRVRAGEKFQEVMSAAKNQPVDVGRAGDTALRIQELAQRGGRMPKAVNDFLRRTTDPKKGDLTYNEARDFLTNISRLSADESMRLTPGMKRLVGELRAVLDKSTEAAAGQVGKANQYRAAMTEYRRAAKANDFLQNTTRVLKKYGTQGAAAAAGGGVTYKVLGEILGW